MQYNTLESWVRGEQSLRLDLWQCVTAGVCVSSLIMAQKEPLELAQPQRTVCVRVAGREKSGQLFRQVQGLGAVSRVGPT
jgi:hypothetical protein